MRMFRRGCKKDIFHFALVVTIIYFLRSRLGDVEEREQSEKESVSQLGNPPIPIDIDHVAENHNLPVIPAVQNKPAEVPEVPVEAQKEVAHKDVPKEVLVQEQDKLNYQDKRHPLCDKTRLSQRIDPATIVVPFCDESLEVLLDVLRSIKDNTWKRIVYEVVFLKGKCKTSTPIMQIEAAITAEYDEAIIARAGDEPGIMQARRRAPMFTSAQTIIFLDIHYRLTPNWLRPLLEVLSLGNNSIVAPLVETLDPKTGQYSVPYKEAITGLDWHLHPRPMPLEDDPKSKLPMPYLSPMLPSPVFGINKEYFKTLGTHDSRITKWGPAQVELSLKAWLCSGSITVVPCSRVLLSRSTLAASEEIDDPVGYKRVLEVWMSRTYRRHIYKRRPDLQSVDPGEILHLRMMKMALKCKDAEYLFENVAKSMGDVFPLVQPPSFANGKIKSKSLNVMCVTSDQSATNKISMKLCNDEEHQTWHLDWRKVLKTSDEVLCWSVGEKDDVPILEDCFLGEVVPPKQIWRYDPVSYHIQNSLNKKCLSHYFTLVQLEDCVAGKLSQTWVFDTINYDLISKSFPKF